ncbi:MAG: hypothetical protein ACFFC7_25005 [Candidatus Hermodarchaeota archaeon]
MAPSSNYDLLGEDDLRRWDIRIIGIACIVLLVQNIIWLIPVINIRTSFVRYSQ